MSKKDPHSGLLGIALVLWILSFAWLNLSIGMDTYILISDKLLRWGGLWTIYTAIAFVIYLIAIDDYDPEGDKPAN